MTKRILDNAKDIRRGIPSYMLVGTTIAAALFAFS